MKMSKDADARTLEPNINLERSGEHSPRAPDYLLYIGNEILPSYIWDYFIRH